jgi:hypothetical protein
MNRSTDATDKTGFLCAICGAFICVICGIEGNSSSLRFLLAFLLIEE